MDVNVNANNAGFKTDLAPVGTAPIMGETAPATGKKASELGSILSNPSLKVTEKSPAERLIEQSYDAAMNTAKNLVDSPAERARKAEERERMEKKMEIKNRAEAQYEAVASERELASVRITQTGGTLDLIDA